MLLEIYNYKLHNPIAYKNKAEAYLFYSEEFPLPMKNEPQTAARKGSGSWDKKKPAAKKFESTYNKDSKTIRVKIEKGYMELTPEQAAKQGIKI